MKYIKRVKALLFSENGDNYFMTIMAAIAICAMLAIISSIMSADIIAMEVKKTAKQQMNNLANIIVEDTYNAMTQGNLEEYERQLHSSSSYRDYLLRTTINNIADDMGLHANAGAFIRYDSRGNESYRLSNFSIEQEEQEQSRIRYIISFTLSIRFQFAGKEYDSFVFPLSYDTYHSKNE